MSRSRSQSRFMRSMTPSGSVKMSTSRFNLVCGRPLAAATTPNLDHVPNPRAPKLIDARVTMPSNYNRDIVRNQRDSSMTRESRRPPPPPPTRDSSLYLPFGSYADRGCHTKPPNRYNSTTSSGSLSTYSKNIERTRRSMTPLSSGLPMTSAHYTAYPSVYSSGPQQAADFRSSRSRRNSFTHTADTSLSQTFSSRQRHSSYTSSYSVGTPAASRGLSFY